MKNLQFTQQLKDYENYQHERRQDFLDRMEQKLERKQVLGRQLV